MRWTIPPRPKSCDPTRGTDWGDGIEVMDDRRGEIACTSDSALSPMRPTVPYGQAVVVGSLRCVVAEAGVRCQNLRTRRGFTAARAAYTVF